MKTNILFVCLGNICRSPAADGIMHHIVEERGLSGRIGIDSAGTYAGHTGELPDARMRRAAARLTIHLLYLKWAALVNNKHNVRGTNREKCIHAQKRRLKIMEYCS